MYGSGSPLLAFLSSVARQLPELAVIVVGFVVVLGRKPAHPKASSLAAAGLAFSALDAAALGLLVAAVVADRAPR